METRKVLKEYHLWIHRGTVVLSMICLLTLIHCEGNCDIWKYNQVYIICYRANTSAFVGQISAFTYCHILTCTEFFKWGISQKHFFHSNASRNHFHYFICIAQVSYLSNMLNIWHTLILLLWNMMYKFKDKMVEPRPWPGRSVS